MYTRFYILPFFHWRLLGLCSWDQHLRLAFNLPLLAWGLWRYVIVSFVASWSVYVFNPLGWSHLTLFLAQSLPLLGRLPLRMPFGGEVVARRVYAGLKEDLTRLTRALWCSYFLLCFWTLRLRRCGRCSSSGSCRGFLFRFILHLRGRFARFRFGRFRFFDWILMRVVWGRVMEMQRFALRYRKIYIWFLAHGYRICFRRTNLCFAAFAYRLAGQMWRRREYILRSAKEHHFFHQAFRIGKNRIFRFYAHHAARCCQLSALLG